MGRITCKSIGQERNWGAQLGQSGAAELELPRLGAVAGRKSWGAGEILLFGTPGLLLHIPVCAHPFGGCFTLIFMYTHTHLPVGTHTTVHLLSLQPSINCKKNQTKDEN